MDAHRLPKNTEEQKRERDMAVEAATREATLVPLGVLEKSISLLKLAKKVARLGNKNSLSDAGVAGLTAQAAAEGAYYNVRINLPSLQDPQMRSSLGRRAKVHKIRAVKLGNDIRRILERGLKRS
jgi:glutamate formiminotransferase/formiminotetrahydrofolate cyclodeaminase